MKGEAFQDKMRDNHCWGCGAQNPAGLHLKSYWDDGIAIAQWVPGEQFAAGPRHFVNGGIIATLLDCHGVCTAIADAFRREHRPIGAEPDIWHATVSLSVEYLRPTPIGEVVRLTGRVLTVEGATTLVECVLWAQAKERARAVVRSKRVPDEWRHGARG